MGRLSRLLRRRQKQPPFQDDDLISKPRTDREQWYRHCRLTAHGFVYPNNPMTVNELRQARTLA